MAPPGAVHSQTWLSRRRLTAIADSCSLASSAGHVARDGRASIIAALASRGRTPVFISENVEAELPKAIDEVARSMGIPAAEVERVMREQVLPRIRVVPLRVGDYLHPRIAGIRRDDPSLPKAMRGDPDDLGTAALAEFLAPAVVISKDSVFNRFGLALPAAQWVEEAQRLLRAAGYESELQGAATAAELVARGTFAGLEAVGRAARQHPKAALGILFVMGGAVFYANRCGWLTTEKARLAGEATMKAAKPVIDRIALASEGWSEAVNGLTVVERDGRLTLAERCARHLAITRAAMTPSELRDILTSARIPLTAAAIRRELQTHPAFTQLADDKYELGRPACLPALEQDAAGPAELVVGARTQLYPLSDVLNPGEVAPPA
jgi:hypothetical protein